MNIANYDPSYIWECATDDGSDCSIDDYGLVTVSNSTSVQQVDLTVKVFESDAQGLPNSGDIHGTPMIPLKPEDFIPQNSGPTSFSGGYQVSVDNFNPLITYNVASNYGEAKLANNGKITVTGLKSGQSARLRIATSYGGRNRSLK